MVTFVNSVLLKHLRGFVLVTYEITYRLPDYRNVLNTLTHQREDIAPDYPALHQYLQWWEKNIDGPIHSVRLAHARLLSEHEVRHIGTEFRLH